MANMAITSNIYGIQPDRTTGQPKPDLVQITDDRSHNVLRDVLLTAARRYFID
jgi:hypothetical protein